MITGKARDRMEKLFENVVDLERHLPAKAVDKIVAKEQQRPGVQEEILDSAYFTSTAEGGYDGDSHLIPFPRFGWDGLDYLDALFELGPYEPGYINGEDDAT